MFLKFLNTILLVGFILYLWGMPPAAAAISFVVPEVNDGKVRIIPGESLEADLLTAGNSIIIEGKVRGDTVSTGRSLTLTGEVTNDVLGVFQKAQLKGNIGNDIRIAAKDVFLEGNIAGGATVLAQNITLKQGGTVGKNMLVAAQNIDLGGKVMGSVRAYAETVTVSGKVEGDLYTEANRLQFLPGSSIGGNLYYRGPQSKPDLSKTEIGGTVEWQQTERKAEKTETTGLLWPLVRLMITAALMAIFFKPLVQRVSKQIRGSRGRTWDSACCFLEEFPF